MQRSREQTATQKLLDQIRGDQSAAPEHEKFKVILPKQKSKALSFGLPAKGMSLGVFISQTHTALALITDRGAAHKKGLVQWQTIPVPEDQSLGTGHFSGILKRCKYPHICFSVFRRHTPLIFIGFILRNICSGTYHPICGRKK